MGLEELRVFYEHDATCTGKDFHPANERGLRICKECAGVFDANGKGIATTDKRFDEPR